MNKICNQQIYRAFIGALALTCAGSVSGQTSSGQKEPLLRPSLEFRFDFGGTPINHGPIPLAYRQVPAHPDDQGISFTIPDGNLQSFLGYGTVSVLPGITVGRVTVRGGPSLQPINTSPGLTRVNTPNFKEINQNGTPERGTGNTLVYNSGKVNKVASLGFIAEGDVRAYEQLSIVGGYATSNYDFVILRGYDRYNSLQALDSKPYSRDQMKNPYAGVRMNADHNSEPFSFGAYLVAGPEFVSINTASGIGIPPYARTSWTIRAGISIGYIRSSKRK